jgi:hypothetical protein
MKIEIRILGMNRHAFITVDAHKSLDREWSLGERRDREQHIKKRNTPTFRSCQIGSAFA